MAAKEKKKNSQKKHELKAFIVEGKLLLKEREQIFSKELMAFNPANAAERVLTLFGSKNKIKRRNIQITEIKASSAKEKEKQATEKKSG